SNKSDFMFLKPVSPILSVSNRITHNNVSRSHDYLASTCRGTLERHRPSTPNEFKEANKDWTLTNNFKNSQAYKRYNSINVESLLPPPPQAEGMSQDDFSCSVAPQYWTWGNHIRESVPDYSWTTRTMVPQRSQVAALDHYQRNVHIPGAPSGYCTLRPTPTGTTPRGDLDVYNSFSTFGKKKRGLMASYDQTLDGGLTIANSDPFE
ncbi:hypothetical protein NHX12_010604, partial [Muraenolepis orangiensis]